MVTILIARANLLDGLKYKPKAPKIGINNSVFILLFLYSDLYWYILIFIGVEQVSTRRPSQPLCPLSALSAPLLCSCWPPTPVYFSGWRSRRSRRRAQPAGSYNSPPVAIRIEIVNTNQAKLKIR